MAYDSPKTIRRRQEQRNNAWGAARRQRRQAQAIKIFTDEEWSQRCDIHITWLNEQAAEGHCEAAGRLAQALVHEAVCRRALEIMREYGRAYWKAMDIARHELCNVEAA